ncbi:MAG: hypothetical protein HZA31_09065 [Opitutae bacterium]|nr:hypothetical protein [Opitutae bacterium]
MNLTPEQKQAVTSWVTSGDSLSNVQKKLREQFQLTLTYMDVRFIVDDLNLELKDAQPSPSASDVTKAPPARPAPEKGEKKGFLDKMKEKVGLGGKADEEAVDAELAEEDELPPEDLPEEAAPPAGLSSVHVTVDKVTLLPGALASGTVTFSDGVTGKWIVDQYGRPGFTEISRPGYRPSQADAQAFMQELGASLQKRGF